MVMNLSGNSQRRNEEGNSQMRFLSNLDKTGRILEPISQECFVTAHFFPSRHASYGL